jgi:hypothetical protein
VIVALRTAVVHVNLKSWHTVFLVGLLFHYFHTNIYQPTHNCTGAVFAPPPPWHTRIAFDAPNTGICRYAPQLLFAGMLRVAINLTFAFIANDSSNGSNNGKPSIFISHALHAMLEMTCAILLLQGVTVIDLVEFRPGGMCSVERIPFRVRRVSTVAL